MTNGEKLKEVFPYAQIDYHKATDLAVEHVTMVINDFLQYYPEWWWNAEYKEPTTKNDLGVDCISRADAIKGLGEQPYVWTDSDFEIQQLADWKTHKEMLENLPTVTPQEPKTGHWIDTNNHQYYNDGDIETTELRCSCCNEEVEWDIELLHKPYFCENCGADMRGSEE